MRATLVLLTGILASCEGGTLDISGGGGAGTLPNTSVDYDGDGFPEDVDCNDYDADIHPYADELCDGDDNDCDGQVDEDAVDREVFYPDADGDGQGDMHSPIWACSRPAGHINHAGDCDDSNPSVHTDAVEVCDPADTDEDCDGWADDADDSTDLGSMGVFYEDRDRDGYGNPYKALAACDESIGVVLDDTDCDDDDEAINPGNYNCGLTGRDGDYKGDLTLELQVLSLTDTCTGEIDGKLDDGEFTGSVDCKWKYNRLNAWFGQPVDMTLEGEVSGSELEGTFQFGTLSEGTWTATVSSRGTLNMVFDGTMTAWTYPVAYEGEADLEQ